ncbi:hypothetical protein Mapa_000811 [Marchantia paleacea]|nr:hypothetical protein Mapa_000811 [Marchantia paleacea]
MYISNFLWYESMLFVLVFFSNKSHTNTSYSKNWRFITISNFYISQHFFHVLK